MPPFLEIILWVLVFGLSLTILLKSADFFIDFSQKLGIKYNVPSFVIGATIVAIGTSLPELAVSLISIFENKPEIIVGTVVGSNISNILLIIGFAIILSSGLKMAFKTFKVEYLFLTSITILCSIFLFDLRISIFEALLLIILMIVYVGYTIVFSSKEEDNKEQQEEIFIANKEYFIFILSFAGIWLGADYTIQALTKLSSMLSIGNDIISQTIMALGTSLPELAVTFSAVKSKQTNIILGNVLGSNIFNLLAVIGIPAIIGNITLHSFTLTNNSFNTFGIPIMIAATLMFVSVSLFKITPKYIGYIFLLSYVLFLIGSFRNFHFY